jgi:hypothetical protein
LTLAHATCDWLPQSKPHTRRGFLDNETFKRLSCEVLLFEATHSFEADPDSPESEHLERKKEEKR